MHICSTAPKSCRDRCWKSGSNLFDPSHNTVNAIAVLLLVETNRRWALECIIFVLLLRSRSPELSSYIELLLLLWSAGIGILGVDRTCSWRWNLRRRWAGFRSDLLIESFIALLVNHRIASLHINIEKAPIHTRLCGVQDWYFLSFLGWWSRLLSKILRSLLIMTHCRFNNRLCRFLFLLHLLLFCSGDWL